MGGLIDSSLTFRRLVLALPAGLQAFARLPIWSPLFLLLAAGIVVYSAWSFYRTRARSDVYYMLLGLYLVAVLLPSAVPAVAVATGVTCPLNGDLTSRLLLAAPVIVLFVLASRAGESAA